MSYDLIAHIKKEFTLKEIDVKEYQKLKVGPMKFNVFQYEIEGIGNLFYLKGKAMFGLMKMDTLMITPLDVDAPLFSYDLIEVLGNSTLLLEQYNTNIEQPDLSMFNSLIKKYEQIGEYCTKPGWYEEILYPQYLHKKDKAIKEECSQMTKEYLALYIELLKTSPKCDIIAKNKLNKEYCTNLVDKGGISTDQFKKALGYEKTKDFFETIVFNIK